MATAEPLPNVGTTLVNGDRTLIVFWEAEADVSVANEAELTGLPGSGLPG